TDNPHTPHSNVPHALPLFSLSCSFFFFNAPATSYPYTLSLHDALPILSAGGAGKSRIARSTHVDLVQHRWAICVSLNRRCGTRRSEEHTSELQSLRHLVCRLLLEKKKKKKLYKKCSNIINTVKM